VSPPGEEIQFADMTLEMKLDLLDRQILKMNKIQPLLSFKNKNLRITCLNFILIRFTENEYLKKNFSRSKTLMSLTSLNRNYSNHPVSCQRGRFAEARQARNDEIRTAIWHAPSKKSRPNIRHFWIPTKKLSCSRSYLGPEE
jgi:hypothetical protein